MKTNLEWLEEMDEPERSQAIENCKNNEPYKGSKHSRSLWIAIDNSFHWDNTPQMYDYWRSIAKKYENGTH